VSEIENVSSQYIEMIKNGELDNLAPVLPFMFTLRGKPFSLKDHMMWEPLFNIKVPKKRTIVCGRQVGKTILSSSSVIAYNGEIVSANNVRVGDKLLCLDEVNPGWKSTYGTVTNVFSNYTKPMRKVTTRSGSEFSLSKDHRLRTPSGYVRSEALFVGDKICRLKRGGVFTGNEVGSDLVGSWMEENIGRCSHERLIPSWAFTLSESSTLMFLSRLWETGGSTKSCKNQSKVDVTYSSSSRKFIDGVQSLLIKFGVLTSIITKAYDKSESTVSYELRVETKEAQQWFLDNIVGSKVGVKEVYGLEVPDVDWDIIASIEEEGDQEAIDFEVETHHNFVLAGGIVTHNSETSAVQLLSWQSIREYVNTLYVAPRDTQTKIFSNDKVAPYISGSPIFSNRNKKLPNGTYTRSIKEGSNMYFSYAFLDAERIRSITAEAIFYDESQDINPSFLLPIGQVMAASPDFGVTQHTGTPKTFDNNLETQWSQSSQAEWCIPCYACNNLNVPAVDFDLLDMIKPLGLSCARCGKLVNTRDGWWEHRYPKRRFRHEGYHGPQPIFPLHCEKQASETNVEVGQKWQEILFNQEEMPTYGFYNEILGTSYDNAAELISKTALVENSTLDHDNSFAASVKLARNRKLYPYVTMGVDWGGGGESGVSRTAIAILGWKGNAKPDVIYMDRILNPLPTDQEALFIKKMATDFGVDFIADDYCGAGEAKEVILLHTGFPSNKLMPIAYVPSRTGKMMEYVAAEDKISRPYIKVARTKSLTIMAALINNGYYKFPKFESWDAKEYPNNLLSLVQEKRDSTRGPASYFITHKPNRSDDLAHAINYASVGYWFVTKNTPDFSKLLGSEFNSE